MSQVLVDTSVWIEMFRHGESKASHALGRLLKGNLVCTHGLIRAEILSGAKSQTHYRQLDEGLSALFLLDDPPHLWDKVGEARYRLARMGHQAGIADLIVAIVAFYHQKNLFTLDKAFRQIKRTLPLKLIELE